MIQTATRTHVSSVHPMKKLQHWRNMVVAAFKGWIKQEITVLLKLAVPIILTLFFQQSLLFVSILFVGRITGESLELDSAALALSVMNVSGVAVGVGLTTAVDTLSSQAYGFKNYKRVGVILQRGIVILGLAMLLIWALWLNTESILLLIGQSPCVARLAGRYMKVYCFALPSLFLYDLLQKYLQTQSIVWTFAIMGFLTNIINVFFHGIFIFVADLGAIGAAIALTISFTSAPVMVILYMWVRKLHKLTWGGWSWESLQQWGQFIKLAVPGLLMICFEWWSVEIVAFISGSISEVELAVNSIWFRIVAILFMLPLGISIAVSVRVGNELGAGNPKGAKRASYIAIGIILGIATLYTIMLQSTKNYIGRIFTRDEVVIKRVGLLMNIACGFLYSDQLQVVISGVLRGTGRQYIGAIVNFICYYPIGLSLGIPLALKADMGTLGLWTGLAVGNIVQALIFVIVLFRTNWEEESQKAIQRSQNTGHKTDVREESRSTEDSTSEFSSEVDESESHARLVFSESPIHTNSEEDDSSSINSKGEDNPQDVLLTGSVEDLEGSIELATAPRSSHCSDITRTQNSGKSKLKLLLHRGGFLIIGVVLLIAGGVCGQYHPHLTPEKYFECSNLQNSSACDFELANCSDTIPAPTATGIFHSTLAESSASMHPGVYSQPSALTNQPRPSSSIQYYGRPASDLYSISSTLVLLQTPLPS